MNVLFPLFCFSLFSSFVELSTDKVFKKFLFLSFTCFIIIFGAFRWETGNDWLSYYRFFIENHTYNDYVNDVRSFEKGYVFINYIVHICFPYTVFLLLTTSFTLVANVTFIKRFTLYPLLSFFLFYCYYFANIVVVRNTIATAFCLSSVKYIVNKNKIRFFLLVFIAVMFHKSAIIFFLAYYIYHKGSIKKLVLLLVVLLVVKETVFKIIFSYSEFQIISKLIYYSQSGGDVLSGYSASLFSKIGGILKKILFLPFFYCLIRKKKNFSGFFCLWLFGVVLYIVAVSIQPSLQRIATNYLFFEVILLPECLVLCKKKYMKYLLLFLILLYGAMKFETNILSYPTSVFTPYKLI